MTYPDQIRREDMLLLINRNYCAKAHVAERISELGDSSAFESLHNSFAKFNVSIDQELTAQDTLLKDLGTEYSFEKCGDQVNYFEDLFTAIHLGKVFKSQELALIYYLEIIQNTLYLTDKLLHLLIVENHSRLSEFKFYNAAIFNALSKEIKNSF